MELVKRYFGFIVVYVLMVGSFVADWGVYDSEIQKAIYLVAPIFSIVTGYLVLNKLGWSGARSSVIKWVWLGMILWLIAEAIILYLDINNLEPYPSLADFFFLVGYPVFFIAVVKEALLFNLDVRKLDKVLLTVLVLLGLIVIGIVSYLGFFVAFSAEETLFVNLVSISWSLGDLFVGFSMMILLAMVWEFRKGSIRYAWSAFMLWGVFNLIADTLYGLFPDALFDASPLSILLDSMWVLGYFLVSFYFTELKVEIEKAQKKLTSKK